MHPTAQWWLKADGVDIVSGLEESVTHTWNGDVDLGDRKLQEFYKKIYGSIELCAVIAEMYT